MGKELKNIIVISPVYNEEKYLSEFVSALLKQADKLSTIKKIIFVDDGSTDASKKLLDRFQKKFPLLEVITFENNFGKGKALRFGFQRAQELSPDGVVFLDSDQQHQPRYLPEFIRNLSQYPIVFGYRHLARTSPFLRRLGNEVAKIIIRNLFHIRRKDLLCGFMAFRHDVFSYLNWRSDDYGVETEISTIVGKNNLPFKEINIKNIYLDLHKGVSLFHAFLILLRIPFWYFSPK